MRILPYKKYIGSCSKMSFYICFSDFLFSPQTQIDLLLIFENFLLKT